MIAKWTDLYIQTAHFALRLFYSFSLPLLSPLASDSALPLMLSASLQLAVPAPLALPVSLFDGAICQAGILLPPPFPAPSKAFAAADVVVVVVEEPLGVDVPLVCVVGGGMFCRERSSVLSDFNSDWRSDKAEDWDVECFSII